MLIKQTFYCRISARSFKPHLCTCTFTFDTPKNHILKFQLKCYFFLMMENDSAAVCFSLDSWKWYKKLWDNTKVKWTRILYRLCFTTQTTLDMAVKPRYCSESRAKEISKCILLMITLDLRPVRVVEGHGLKDLMHYLQPGYTISSRKHFTKLLSVVNLRRPIA